MNFIGDPYFDNIINRVYRQDKDAIIIHAGERGSTKSGDALTTGLTLDLDKNGLCRFWLPDNLVPKQLHYILKKGYRFPRLIVKPSDFMKIVSEPKLPMGSVVVWDETGVEGDARDFATKKNKLLKRTMETIRSKNLIVILTAPTLKSFDIGFTRSMSYFVYCLGAVQLDGGKKFGKAFIYENQTNAKTGDTYQKRIRMTDVNGKRYMLDSYYFPKPPWRVEMVYKKYKDLFQTKLYREYANELDSIDELIGEGEEKRKSVKDYAEEISREPGEYFDGVKKKFMLEPIMYEYDVSRTMAYAVKQLLDYRYNKGLINLD